MTIYGATNYSEVSQMKGESMNQSQKPPSLDVALTPAMFQVLLALGDGEKHGYAILKDVEGQTDGHVHLSTGTLYAIIKRLLAEGVIEECRNRPPAEEDDQRRRYYRLTPTGRHVVVAEAERMEKLIATARQKNFLHAFKAV